MHAMDRSRDLTSEQAARLEGYRQAALTAAFIKWGTGGVTGHDADERQRMVTHDDGWLAQRAEEAAWAMLDEVELAHVVELPGPGWRTNPADRQPWQVLGLLSNGGPEQRHLYEIQRGERRLFVSAFQLSTWPVCEAPAPTEPL